jgi:hypothetical protein
MNWTKSERSRRPVDSCSKKLFVWWVTYRTTYKCSKEVRNDLWWNPFFSWKRSAMVGVVQSNRKRKKRVRAPDRYQCHHERKPALRLLACGCKVKAMLVVTVMVRSLRLLWTVTAIAERPHNEGGFHQSRSELPLDTCITSRTKPSAGRMPFSEQLPTDLRNFSDVSICRMRTSMWARDNT